VAYFVNLFSPETYEVFSNSKRNLSGFRISQQNAASKINVGDRFVCYMTKLSRWVGILEVNSLFYIDETPFYYTENDPFVVRFGVTEVVWLPKELAVPIRDDRVWNELSFTRGQNKKSFTWTAMVRSSLRPMDNSDGAFLEELLLRQDREGEQFEVDELEYQKLVSHRVRRLDKVVTVSVPQDNKTEEVATVEQPEVRESIRMQALIASIGASMGMSIWIPRSDRASVYSEWNIDDYPVLDNLPLNYDEATLRTIEQIDILWLKGRSIVRAFEVEHTTSIYSGLLRMADLLALQPNMDIKLHIVAPESRREKVFQELQRPVFSLLEKGPLYEICTYLSYDSVRELSHERHLAHLSDSVLDDYAEEAD
jgi:hypothetical protein